MCTQLVHSPYTDWYQGEVSSITSLLVATQSGASMLMVSSFHLVGS